MATYLQARKQVLSLVPALKGWKTWLGVPAQGASPPWVVVSFSEFDRQHTESLATTSHVGRLDIRVVGETDESIDAESFMITRDYNFVNVDFYVEYRVTDPVKYLYSSENPVAILKNLTQSYIRDTIGLYDVDSVITTGKSEIQASIKEKIVTRLDQEDIGIQLVNITIQDAEPPTQEVINAFKNVENAKQGKETSINKANQKRNEDIPAARAAADETVKTAQAQAEERVNEAKGQVARLNELYAEYQKYPLITKQRMFYETMEDILPDMKVIIERSDGSTQTMLPLEPFAGTGISTTENLETEAQ